MFPDASYTIALGYFPQLQALTMHIQEEVDPVGNGAARRIVASGILWGIIK